MGEKCLPNTKLDLMHEVDDKHLWHIKFVAKFLNKSVLICISETSVKALGTTCNELTNVGTDEVDFSKR
jgi:hypothetical protein